MIMVFEDKEVDFNNVYFYSNEAALFFMRRGADLELRSSIVKAIISGRARIFDTTAGKVAATNSSFEGILSNLTSLVSSSCFDCFSCVDNASGSSQRALMSFEERSEGKFKECRFIRNKSKGHGGVFFANKGSILDIEDCYFTSKSSLIM